MKLTKPEDEVAKRRNVEALEKAVHEEKLYDLGIHPGQKKKK
jgi:hypothetical protein